MLTLLSFPFSPTVPEAQAPQAPSPPRRPSLPRVPRLPPAARPPRPLLRPPLRPVLLLRASLRRARRQACLLSLVLPSSARSRSKATSSCFRERMKIKLGTNRHAFIQNNTLHHPPSIHLLHLHPHLIFRLSAAPGVHCPALSCHCIHS